MPASHASGVPEVPRGTQMSVGRRPLGVSDTGSLSGQVPHGSGGRGGRRRPGFSSSGATEVHWDTAVQGTSPTTLCRSTRSPPPQAGEGVITPPIEDLAAQGARCVAVPDWHMKASQETHPEERGRHVCLGGGRNRREPRAGPWSPAGLQLDPPVSGEGRIREEICDCLCLNLSRKRLLGRSPGNGGLEHGLSVGKETPAVQVKGVDPRTSVFPFRYCVFSAALQMDPLALGEGRIGKDVRDRPGPDRGRERLVGPG